MTHAFEAMDCLFVQFSTDVLNTASRAAIVQLGAVEAGTIRHERIMPDRRKRDSVRYSVIDSERPAVRVARQDRLLR